VFLAVPFDAFVTARVVPAVAAVAGGGGWELFFTVRMGTGARFSRALALDALFDRGVAEVAEEGAAGACDQAAERRCGYLFVGCQLFDR
jgi:hypothetical protein